MIKKWTEEEIQFLKDHYPEKGAIWCAERLGVKKSRINTKAEKLKIKSDRYNDKKNEEKFIELIRSKNGIPLWDEWLGTHHKHLIRCGECNHEWNCYPVNVIRKNKTNWCPACAQKIRISKKRKCSEWHYHNMAKLYEGKWIGKSTPPTMKSKTEWVCKIGHGPFYASYRQILTCGFLPCPDCKRPWIGQTVTKMYLEQFTGLEFPTTRPDFLKYKNGYLLELDGYNKKAAIAFEYNGNGHYTRDPRQTEEDFIKLQKRDEWKYLKTKENGIKLLIIREPEKGVSLNKIRTEVLKFIVENGLPLVDGYENIFINPAKIYLTDPRIKVAEEALILKLIPISDVYVDRNTPIPFQCLQCNGVRGITPYAITVAVRKGKTVYCPNCSLKLGLIKRMRKRALNA